MCCSRPTDPGRMRPVPAETARLQRPGEPPGLMPRLLKSWMRPKRSWEFLRSSARCEALVQTLRGKWLPTTASYVQICSSFLSLLSAAEATTENDKSAAITAMRLKCFMVCSPQNSGVKFNLVGGRPGAVQIMATRRTLAIAAWTALPLAGCGTSTDPQLAAPPLAGDPYAFDRSIDLSDATGPLPLDTPDDAARAAIGARLFYASALDTLASGKAAHAKADTESCPDGGTRTSDNGSTSRSERYDQCLDGDRYLDGFWSADITSPGYPWSNARAQLGENDTTLLAENRDPANDVRSLELG